MKICKNELSRILMRGRQQFWALNDMLIVLLSALTGNVKCSLNFNFVKRNIVTHFTDWGLTSLLNRTVFDEVTCGLRWLTFLAHPVCLIANYAKNSADTPDFVVNRFMSYLIKINDMDIVLSVVESIRGFSVKIILSGVSTRWGCSD